MLTDEQKRMITQITEDEKCKARLHPFELEWVNHFKLRFREDNDPCVGSQKTLIAIWKKAIGKEVHPMLR
jgi:hypothetical protein